MSALITVEYRVLGEGAASGKTHALSTPLHNPDAIGRAIARANKPHWDGKPIYRNVRVEKRQVSAWVPDGGWRSGGIL